MFIKLCVKNEQTNLENTIANNPEIDIKSAEIEK
jgi:hypothetical protein